MSSINRMAAAVRHHAESGKFIFYLPTASYDVVSAVAHSHLGLDPRLVPGPSAAPERRPDCLMDLRRHAASWRALTGDWCGTPYPPAKGSALAVFSTWSYRQSAQADAQGEANCAYRDFFALVTGELLAAAREAANALGDEALLAQTEAVAAAIGSQSAFKRNAHRIEKLDALLGELYARAKQNRQNDPACAQAYDALRPVLVRWAIPDGEGGFGLALTDPQRRPDEPDMRLHYAAFVLTPGCTSLAGDNAAALMDDLILYAQYQTALRQRQRAQTAPVPLFLYGENLTIPAALEPYTAKLPMEPIDEDDVALLVREQDGPHAELSPQTRAFYVNQFSACPLPEARALLCEAKRIYGSVCDPGRACSGSPERLRAFIDRRVTETLNRKIGLHGKLEFKTIDHELLRRNPPVGFGSVMDWFERHRQALLDGSQNAPKGLLLTGIPGGGKTYFASWLADALGVKLLTLDMGKVLGSYVGQSEASISEITSDLDSCGSFVLLVDEVEKALAGSKGGDSTGVMTRVTGKLLSWLQDRRNARVFVVFTANDMSQLPPELRRSGRVDAKYTVLCPRRADLIAQLARLLPEGSRSDEAAVRYIDAVWTAHRAFMTGADVALLAKEIRNAYDAGGKMPDPACVAMYIQPQIRTFDKPETLSCYLSYYEDSYIAADETLLPPPGRFDAKRPILFTAAEGAGQDSLPPFPLDLDGWDGMPDAEYDRAMLLAINEALGRQIVERTDPKTARYMVQCWQREKK